MDGVSIACCPRNMPSKAMKSMVTGRFLTVTGSTYVTLQASGRTHTHRTGGAAIRVPIVPLGGIRHVGFVRALDLPFDRTHAAEAFFDLRKDVLQCQSGREADVSPRRGDGSRRLRNLQ